LQDFLAQYHYVFQLPLWSNLQIIESYLCMVKALPERPDLTTRTPERKDALAIALYRRVGNLEVPPVRG
jgi:hypothetical protein